ncbi:SIS domain-containing protein [Acidithiobacillus thiooxidans]|uniref:Glutamine--fructose-6-phosphate aminotransferase [isomerizing] n=1 Tax=Acidithiobacillus thiooxidans ATCC 19377 TaxID=637390 RepID=A0A543Q004_ACITH|nr:SIS domain-containing protein [Acidithiobacillus thiooxidans]MDX5936347.1 SIS domain-containing protein [Acidithiobacillus thiooxidans]TQN49652.1 Glutamine--fructose-6-phosphate aminotransferase [isomerizing] [Acidithiobacillus thiooxidans ATCC 19377]
MKRQYAIYDEIMSQPECFDRTRIVTEVYLPTFKSLISQALPDGIILMGCGSMYNLALSIQHIWRKYTELSIYAITSSEMWLNETEIKKIMGADNWLLISLSRSGETSETIIAHQLFPGPKMCITCHASSTLNIENRHNFILPDSAEKAIPETRAFTSMYAAITQIVLSISEAEPSIKAISLLKPSAERVLLECSDTARALADSQTIKDIFILGSDSRYGLAREAALKIKEVAVRQAESCRFMEFRHGPQALVGTSTLIIGMISDTFRNQEEKVLADMRSLGASTLTIGESGCDINFNSGIIDEDIRGPLYLLFIHLFAYYGAILSGKDPDTPRNLSKVVELSDRFHKIGNNSLC